LGAAECKMRPTAICGKVWHGQSRRAGIGRVPPDHCQASTLDSATRGEHTSRPRSLTNMTNRVPVAPLARRRRDARTRLREKEHRMSFLFELFSGTLLNSFAGLFTTLIQLPAMLLQDLVNAIVQAVFMTT